MPAQLPKHLYEIIQNGSQEWAWLSEWMERDLARCRGELETIGLDVVRTESLRARIDVLKSILREAEPPTKAVELGSPYEFGGPD